MPLHTKGLLSTLIVSDHHRAGNTPLRNGGIPQRPRLVRSNQRVRQCRNISSCIDISHTGAQLIVNENAPLLLHRNTTMFCEAHSRLCTCTCENQLTGDHLLMIGDHACDGTNASHNAGDLRFQMDSNATTAESVEHEIGGCLVKDMRHQGLATHQPMYMNTPMEQAGDSLNSMGAPTDHNCVGHFSDTAAEVKVILQTVEGEHAIKVTTLNMLRQFYRTATGSNQKRIIAKSTPAIQADVLVLSMNSLHVSIDNMDPLDALGSRGIREQLLTGQLIDGKLFQRRRVDCRMNLIRHNHNALVRSKATSFYGCSQA